MRTLTSNSRETSGHLGSLFDNEAAVDEFFSPPTRGRSLPKLKGRERPTHYRGVSVTLYSADVERLEALLRVLKERGHTRANKSMIIREALRQIDLDLIPPQR